MCVCPSVLLVLEALEIVICDVIKIRLKRMDATRSEKGNQPLNIKTAVKRPISKLGLPNFRWSLYFILLLVASLIFVRIFMTSRMTLSSASRTKMVQFFGPNRRMDKHTYFFFYIRIVIYGQRFVYI